MGSSAVAAVEKGEFCAMFRGTSARPPAAQPSSLPSISSLSLSFLGTYPQGETFTTFGSCSKFREHVFRANKIPPKQLTLEGKGSSFDFSLVIWFLIGLGPCDTGKDIVPLVVLSFELNTVSLSTAFEIMLDI